MEYFFILVTTQEIKEQVKLEYYAKYLKILFIIFNFFLQNL